MKIGNLYGSYKPAFVKRDGDWGAQDIKKGSLGGNSIFNTCNFGILSTHGCYGTQPEIDGVKYTYLLISDFHFGQAYVRLSDMDFGSPGNNGLKWMTILSCNTLFPANVTSMANNSKLPDNQYLHLLLGNTTVSYSAPDFGLLYASNLVFNTTIWTSYQNACRDAYSGAVSRGAKNLTNAASVRVMGFQSCINDTLFQYSDPDPNTPYQILTQNIFTP